MLALTFASAAVLAFVLVLVAAAIFLFLRISLARARQRISYARTLARLRDPAFRRATNLRHPLPVRLDGTDEVRASMLWRREGGVRIIRA